MPPRSAETLAIRLANDDGRPLSAEETR